MPPHLTCPRCSQLNETRARFCANCGLNLAVAGVAAPIGAAQRARQNRSGRWVVLTVISLAGAFLAMLFAARAVTPRMAPPPLRAWNQGDDANQDAGQEYRLHRRIYRPAKPYHGYEFNYSN